MVGKIGASINPENSKIIFVNNAPISYIDVENELKIKLKKINFHIQLMFNLSNAK